MIKGFDVSHHQQPELFDWEKMEKEIGFVIARASYGAGEKSGEDRHFAEFARRCRRHGIVFGAYHFYRQIHGVEEQLAKFDKQLQLIGGLKEGELLPVLDMEDNRKYDGYPNAQVFSDGCLRMATAFVERYGGCILYYSSYFPEYLKTNKLWIKSVPSFYHWMADYDRKPGEPRIPYSPTWHMHQPRPKPTPLYADGKTVVDHDVLNPEYDLSQLCIQTKTGAVSNSGPSPEAEAAEEETSARPGVCGEYEEGEAILRFFNADHLPEHLAAVAKPFVALAAVLMELPPSAERSVALRKLLESKDAAVRAAL